MVKPDQETTPKAHLGGMEYGVSHSEALGCLSQLVHLEDICEILVSDKVSAVTLRSWSRDCLG
jgi:hypothetical protein